MAGAVFVPDPAAWQFEFRSWGGVVGRYMIGVVNRGTALAKASAPGPAKPPRNRTGINYSTGRLETQILPGRGRWMTELEGRVIALPKYSLFVHEGTKPHAIYPKKPGGHLAFYWHKVGRFVVLRHVNHPGTAPIPFLSENLAKMVK